VFIVLTDIPTALSEALLVLYDGMHNLLLLALSSWASHLHTDQTNLCSYTL
jgi:hypothetical protein